MRGKGGFDVMGPATEAQSHDRRPLLSIVPATAPNSTVVVPTYVDQDEGGELRRISPVGRQSPPAEGLSLTLLIDSYPEIRSAKFSRTLTDRPRLARKSNSRRDRAVTEAVLR